jgi:LPS export ABC transporter protein LptC
MLLILTACSKQQEEIFLSEEEASREVVENFQTTYSDSAVIKVKFSGPVMWRVETENKSNNQIFPEGIYVEFFDSNQNKTGVLTAKYGIRNDKDKKVIVSDSVVWHIMDRETFETEELVWDEKTEKLSTNRFVTIQRKNETIYAHGFESDQNFTYLKVNAPEAFIKQEEEEPITPNRTQ